MLRKTRRRTRNSPWARDRSQSTGPRPQTSTAPSLCHASEHHCSDVRELRRQRRRKGPPCTRLAYGRAPMRSLAKSSDDFLPESATLKHGELFPPLEFRQRMVTSFSAMSTINEYLLPPEIVFGF